MNDNVGQTRHRQTLLILAVIFFAPFIAAWIIFNFTEIGRNKAGTNHGDLILPPRQIADLELIDPGHKELKYRLYGRWNIVYLASGKCDSECEDKLYMMQQIRLALGQDAHRVQRALVVYNQNPDGLSDAQTKNLPGQLLILDTEQARTAFQLTVGELPVNLRRLYIIDPSGYLVMSYAEGTDPAGIIKDLKRLLKYSRTG